MYNKAFPPSKSFYVTCRYVCQDENRSEVIYYEGVRINDWRHMARDFEAIHQLRPTRQKPVFHAVLDFLPLEQKDDPTMVEIGKKFLAELGYSNSQYVIAKHTDKPHIHLHIIANRITYDGEFINKDWETLRQVRVAEKLVKEYQLQEASQKKNLQNTALDMLNISDANRYKIYQFITESIPHCQNIKELEERLSSFGVETRYLHQEQTGLRKGISFRYNNEAFKGSKIDRSFCLQGLEKIFSLKLSPWEEEKLQAQKAVLSPTIETREDLSQNATVLPSQKLRPTHKLRL